MLMHASRFTFLLAAAALAAPTLVLATGDYGIPSWLEQGGQVTAQSPEFFWHRELRKIAAPFKPTQKRMVSIPKTAADANAQPEVESLAAQAARLDGADYAEAIKAGLIKEADAAAKHEAARQAIAAANETTTTPLPDEPEGEFRDYNRGAFAFHLGSKHYDEAAQLWEGLLKRPAAERHYRSVWAAFMLGKLDVFAQRPEAPKWFRMARQLAKDGFADSLGLAADSYGWEAKSELEQDHLEKAAQLYLTQLALGDDSAIVSLKALVPDREAAWGMMNFGPQPADDADEATKKKFSDEREAGMAAKLARAAHDPLLRRITTAHVLAIASEHSWYEGSELPAKRAERSHRWLSAVEKAGVSNVEDAPQLGWVAYTSGDYKQAVRWLKLASTESAATLWLKSKLLRREGNLKEAADLMAAALKMVREEDPEEAPSRFTDGPEFVQWFPDNRQPVKDASADLATLHLARGEFVNALDVFLSHGLWFDAAYVAERVLTLDELKKYVDEHYPASSVNEPKDGDLYAARGESPARRGKDTRWLLGRRMVREDRYQEAREYLPKEHIVTLDKYVKSLDEAANEKLPKARRARAWFDAATIARYSGMELMGTEGAPDHSVSEGSFEFADIASERETASIKGTKFEGDKEVPDIKPIRLVVPVTPEEKKRLANTKPAPDKRFHYRYIAAALGWKAALLLPDQSDELADVLNASGGWIKKDDKAADKFIQAIERRAAKTKLGKVVSKSHWFVENTQGPWSKPPAEQ